MFPWQVLRSRTWIVKIILNYQIDLTIFFYSPQTLFYETYLGWENISVYCLSIHRWRLMIPSFELTPSFDSWRQIFHRYKRLCWIVALSHHLDRLSRYKPNKKITTNFGKILRPKISNTQPPGRMWPTRYICVAREHLKNWKSYKLWSH